MIFLDTNYFLRHFAPATDSLTERLQNIASELFLAVEAGSLEVTTSEVVLHEVLYLLTAKNHFNLAADEAVDMIEYTIQMRGFKFDAGEQSIFLRALAIWRDRPSLGFADSVIAARCEANGWELATFDEELGALSSISRWRAQPE